MRWNRWWVLAFCLAIVPRAMALKPGVDRSPFGAQAVWPNEPDIVKYLDAMQEAGIQWGRFDLCWWSLAERTPGDYRFDAPDVPGYEDWNTTRAIQLMRERNIEPFPILCYGNPLYDNEQGPSSEAGRKAYAEFCFAAASKYRHEVTYWEIWNEPNLQQFWGRAPHAEDYAKMAVRAAARIRQANPNAIIAGGATSGIDLHFLRKAFDAGLLEAIDIVTIHPYRDRLPPESINGEVAQLRQMIQERTQKPIRIWTGEWGYNTAWSTVDEWGQAKMLSRMMVNNLSQGIELSIWFSTNPFPEIASAPDDPQWGLVDYQFGRRPSFHAMKTVNERLPAPVRLMGNALNVSVSPSVPDLRIETFQAGLEKGCTVAIWVANWPLDASKPFEKMVTLRIDLDDDSDLLAYDGLTGKNQRLPLERKGAKMEIPAFALRDYPVFIVCEEMNP